MDAIIVKCTEIHTADSVNGPLTRVTLVPDGPFNTHKGELVVFVPSLEDKRLYRVGALFRLTPEPIKEVR